MSRERAEYAESVDAAAAETPAERMPSELTVTVDDKSITMKGLKQINIILGRNGCGKSRLLNALHKQFESDASRYVSYVKAERGDRKEETRSPVEPVLYKNDDEERLSKNIVGVSDRMSRGSTGNFTLFNDGGLTEYCVKKLNFILDNIVVSIEPDQKIYKFIDNIRLRFSEGPALDFSRKGSDLKLNLNELSSGEIEIITMVLAVGNAIQSMRSHGPHSTYYLLMDESDVRLHPDLQVKIADFIMEIVGIYLSEYKLQVIITTHSTALLSAFAKYPGVSVCFMKPNTDLIFEPLSPPASNIMKNILPIFGAHPLSQIFNESPIFLVEGTDEERIWQQAIRSSEGKLKLYPRETGGKTKGKMLEFEDACNRILPSIYDYPIAYSLRDRDGIVDDADVAMPKYHEITRLRLYCQASENLLLSDEVIVSLGNKHKVAITWIDIKAEVEHWLLKNISDELKTHIESEYVRKCGVAANWKDIKWDDIKLEVKDWLSNKDNAKKEKPQYKAMVKFAENFARKTAEIKVIRNTFRQIIEDAINRKLSQKGEEQITVNTEWETLVGQAIGKWVLAGTRVSSEDSIVKYLGPEIVKCLLERSSSPSEFASAARVEMAAGERGSTLSTAANPQRLRGRSTPAATVDATTSSTLAPTSGGAGTT